MVKAYLKYAADGVFGVVASPECNSLLVPHTTQFGGNLLVTGALESVAFWDLRQSSKAMTLNDAHGDDELAQPEVTCLARTLDGSRVASGYSNGTVKVWTVKDKKCTATFHGHKNRINALHFHSNGTVLASGGNDTDIVVWDVVGEVGLYRLRGHKGSITALHFLEKSNKIVSSSKDTLVKVWDLDTQHCIHTIVGHRAEVWSLDVNEGETRLVTGSNDHLLRVYALDMTNTAAGGDASMDVDTEGDDGSGEDAPVFIGALGRRAQANERVSSVQFTPCGSFLVCQSAGKTLEFYRVHTHLETLKRRKKRRIRHKRKQEKQAKLTHDNVSGGNTEEEVAAAIDAADEYSSAQVMKTPHKISSMCFSAAAAKKSTLARFAITYQNNSADLFELPPLRGPDPPRRVSTIQRPGHTSDVRAVCLSSDDALLASASQRTVRVWNTENQQCLRVLSLGSEYALSLLFVPANRHLIVGMKSGAIHIYDLASSALHYALDEAHSGPVWSLTPLPDRKGFVSGSGDNTVRFWAYELTAPAEGGGAKHLSLKCQRELRLEDDVLAVCCSPDGKLVAASSLDNTIKIFFLDSLKLFLTLYGHKLPAMSLDISSDSTLLVSGSADKNIKLWGLDFGDCHKSLFAHVDSVMAVRFQPETHYLFTAGKDALVNYWDADTFEQISSLEGHHGEIWSMAVSSVGDFVVTGSHDRSLRIWRRTDEPLFLEEERERKMERVFDASVEDQQRRLQENREKVNGVEAATRQTMDTVRSGERILDAIELCERERVGLRYHDAEVEEKRRHMSDKEVAKATAGGQPLIQPPAPNPLLIGRSPSGHLLHTIRGVRSSELEEALTILPFDAVVKLFTYLDEWVGAGVSLELVCRCVEHLLRLHQNQITSNRMLLTTLSSIRKRMRRALQEQKDIVGFNRAAMATLLRDAEGAQRMWVE
eukprot:TRINITY_DN7382_c0_g1_i1.p1 TRINITY_DN7382_c0_g1~~TRINITY_DN7382_c0_g1_i1.p1  ORF type:complete len:943 (-),score=213.51 TRINITY_DN7382_c0_g1_i1:33-2837(-)